MSELQCDFCALRLCDVFAAVVESYGRILVVGTE